METVVELRDGRRAGYATYGDPDGRPLVLLHGFSDSRLGGRVFDGAARDAGVRVLALDRPGIGLSTGRLESLAACAGWLRAVAETVGLGEYALAAVSGGAPFALACAEGAPPGLTRVLVVSGLGPPQLGYAGTAPAERLAIAVGRRLPRLGAAVLAGLAAAARRRPELFLSLVRMNVGSTDAASIGGSSRGTIVEPFAEAYRQGPAGVRNELALILRSWDVHPERISLPVRFEHGADDRTVPPRVARALAGRIPGATVAIRPGAGHFTVVPRHAAALVAWCVDSPA